jgi:hypothetical protein
MKLTKVTVEYKFNPKRNFNLTTPCCNRKNKDGKFSTYIGLPDIYGYCHSCGKTTLPPTIFIDENGVEYMWNEIQNKFEPCTNPLQNFCKNIAKTLQNPEMSAKKTKYIPESMVWEYYATIPENNLLQYLFKVYDKTKVEDAKETYFIGTSKDGGTVFWNVNSELKVQKAKISYYNEDGKRTNKFVVPYKNEDGYFACLFGEHLIYDKIKGKKTIILVESEKTAIVGYILMPEYIWVAYGGSNGLTDDKIKPLIGHTVVIIPDMSESAVNIIYEKIPVLISMGINAKVWDMTNGKTDEQLKTEGIYNNDLEDIFRKFIVNTTESN